MDACDIADANLPLRADKVALIHHGRRYRYRDLADEVERLAGGLSREHHAGDLLAIWLPNGPEILCLYLACLKTGIVPMPLHEGMTWPEVGKILRYSGAKTMIACARTRARMPADYADAGIDRVYVHGAAEHPMRPYEELRHAEGVAHGPGRIDHDDLAMVLHTSGSEGLAKGVMLSHGNLNRILDYRLAHTGLAPDSLAVVASCLTQSVGLHQSLAMLAAGGTIVLLDHYDIDPMVAAIHRHRPSHLIMVVSAFDRLLHHPAITGASLASTRFASAGADQVTARLQERFIALTGRPLNTSYGLTESSWAIVNNEGRHDKALALGQPCPGIEIKLVDGKGDEVADGETGEILIRSPRTMLGYLHNPSLTGRVLRDGWLSSGDLAYRDAEGYFWFAGRCKNIIVLSSGDTVSPIEVERALLEHPAVAQCAVRPARTGGPDDSEVPWAYVTCQDASLSEADLAAFLRGRLSAYKIPERIFFVTELPLGLTGKTRRSVCSTPDPTGLAA
ncbi:MAG: class I adenylate-forming enzyme family protein [Gallionellaceae bacterium]|nr:class I adenylate-forming enzyme family protein [Gallionellaceae bacterium]